MRVTVLGQSNVETTVTPQTIRSAVREALDMGMQLPEVKERVMQLLPNKRVNQVDYLESSRILTNSQGVLDEVDSIWLNAITERGLREGWMQVDPDTLQQVYNRKAALELDLSDAIGRMGQGIDQADDAARYQQWLEGKEPMNPGSMDPQVQGRLGEMENPQQAAASAARPEGPDESAQLQQWLQQQEGANRQVNNVNPPNDAIQDRLAQMDANSAYDQWEAQQANPAVAAGERDAAIGANELDALDDEQMGRLAADVVAEDNPFDVVADGLGIDANNIPRADVVKAEVAEAGMLLASMANPSAALRPRNRPSRRLSVKTLGCWMSCSDVHSSSWTMALIRCCGLVSLQWFAAANCRAASSSRPNRSKSCSAIQTWSHSPVSSRKAEKRSPHASANG